MITKDEYLKGRNKKYPLNDVQTRNMNILLRIINQIRTECGKPMIVSSGYRDPESNKAAGGSPRSCHLTCEAIDIQDLDGSFKQWVLDHDILERYNLYMENPLNTPTWAHLQTRKTASGKRIFKP